ncbi:MAG: hypothetical protein B1H03_03165 [Planctomycetales bacterium 4484_113]|nr:MAG: hypothetical protein B1H03_03165 [Planctomycetales bacterium 4484_113]
MDDERKQTIRFLERCADSLAQVEEIMRVYVTAPNCLLGGKVALIDLAVWTPQCLETDDEVYSRLCSLWEQREEELADALLVNKYCELALEEASHLAQTEEGELLGVHWTNTLGTHEWHAAYIIVIDAEKFHRHHLCERRGDAEGDIQS